jgi:hypothetical protein
MVSKNIKQVMSRYLQEIFELYHRDDSPGINDYCSALKNLLYSSIEFLPGNVSKDDVVIEINQKLLPGVQGGGFLEKSPPGRRRQSEELQIHMPCIRIWDGKAKVYGYIDVLAPGTPKKEIKSYYFVDLYKRVFPNLILTNFFEFIYYKGGKKVCTARPFSASYIKGITKEVKVTSTRIFLKVLQHFFGYSDKKSKVPSFIRLQRRLALKTYYLKEYILTPLINHLLISRVKCELVRLYRAYCYFFDRELSIELFSAFLSHVIIDGFLRAGIFYSTTNLNPVKPFSRCRVFKYAKFNTMPARRLAVFKYLSPGSGDQQLPGAVQWFLDEICGFLANFDFKQMCFPWKNPMLIDGELLQWESYFFSPYYDNPGDRERVKELLVKEGIFGGE